MILAHLADLHLGFSAYPRHERGRNVREADVAVAFMRAVDELVGLRPDVVLVAGDVFDRPDPPSAALVTFARGLELLRAALPETPVLVVAGPRDTPRRVDDPGVLAALDTVPGVEAAATAARSVRVNDSLTVHLLPHRAALVEPPALLGRSGPPQEEEFADVLPAQQVGPRGGNPTLPAEPPQVTSDQAQVASVSVQRRATRVVAQDFGRGEELADSLQERPSRHLPRSSPSASW